MSKAIVSSDFENQLLVVDFPFKAIIIRNMNYKADLQKEFARLPFKPRLDLFINDSLSKEEWKKYLDNKNAMRISNSNTFVAANFVPFHTIETKVKELIKKFHDLSIEGNINRKYYGSLLNETEIVKILNEVELKIDYLKNYAFDALIADFADVATDTANFIIKSLNDCTIQGLKKEVLTDFINSDKGQSKIFQNYLFDRKSQALKQLINFDQKVEIHKPLGDVKSIYARIKNRVDFIFIEEIQRQSNCPTTVGTPDDSAIPDTVFEEPLIRELRIHFDNILWEEEDIDDNTFLNYWRPGRNEKKLQIKNNTGLIYLVENKLKKYLIDQEMLQKTRAELFQFSQESYNDYLSKINKNISDHILDSRNYRLKPTIKKVDDLFRKIDITQFKSFYIE